MEDTKGIKKNINYNLKFNKMTSDIPFQQTIFKQYKKQAHKKTHQ